LEWWLYLTPLHSGQTIFLERVNSIVMHVKIGKPTAKRVVKYLNFSNHKPIKESNHMAIKEIANVLIIFSVFSVWLKHILIVQLPQYQDTQPKHW
jgi:hypothetical protein